MRSSTYCEMARTIGRVLLLRLLLLIICNTALMSAQTTDSTFNQFNVSQYTIVLDPPDVLEIKQRTEANLTITVTPPVHGEPVMIRLVVGQSQTTQPMILGIDAVELNVTSNATVTGVFLLTGSLIGKETILFAFYPINQPDQFLGYSPTTYSIYGLKVATEAASITTMLVAVFISLTIASFACRLNGDAIKAFFRGPKIGLLTVLISYIIMPPISFGLAFAWGMPYNIIFALLGAGCCPPGGPANALVLLMGGELESSIVITALGTVLSVAFFPIWMSTLGQWICVQAYGSSYVLRFPILTFDLFICIFFVPSIVTFTLSYKWPRAGRLIFLILRPLSLIGTLAFFVVMVILNYGWLIPLVIDWTYVACPASISLVGYAIGFCVAIFIGRLSIDKAITFSVQTGLANITFALVMSSLMLPEPDGSTVFAPCFFFVVTSLTIAFIMVFLAAVGRRIYDRYVPKSFALSATDHRLEDEKRRTERTEKKMALTRSVSVISQKSGFSPDYPKSFDEKNASTTSLDFGATDVEYGRQSEGSERKEDEKKVVFVIDKW